MEFDAEAFFNSDMPVSEWIDAPIKESSVDLVMRIRKAIGRKFEVGDITDGGAEGTLLYDAAVEWLPSQENASFEWLADLARKYKRGGGLTDSQAKGVLNCLVADENRKHNGLSNGVATGMRQIMARHDVSVADKELDLEIKAAQEYEDFLAEQAATVTVDEGYYTVAFPDGARRTIKIGKWVDDKRNPGQKMRWISYLTGPNNESDYQWFARQQQGRGYVVAPKYRVGHPYQLSALQVIFNQGGAVDAQQAYAMESSRCARCNRVLTVPASLHAGLGPECAKKGVF